MDDDWLPEAVTITFVRGLDPREVGDLLAVDWDTGRRLTFGDAEALQDLRRDAQPVQLAERDGWVVVVEPNGYWTSQTHVVEALSRRGEAVSVYWSVKATSEFVLARDGAMVRAFDPVLFDDEEGDPLPEEEGLPFGSDDADPYALALELATRLTGVPVEGSWLLETPHPTWLAAGPPEPDAPPRGTVHLTRPADDGGLLRRLVLEIDGTEQASLRRGESVDHRLRTGPHRIRTRWGRTTSELVHFELAEGDVVRLEVRRPGDGGGVQRL
ncbi:DUF6461 domain-containing protein [Blastococcus sp. SYSU D00813]